MKGKMIFGWKKLLSIAGVLIGGAIVGSQVQVYAATSSNSEKVATWDTVYFGSYWQNDTNGDGVADQKDAKQAIQWRVLERNGDYAYLLSDKILDAGKFCAGSNKSTWETSDLRNWLNATFYNEAFNSKEKEAIQIRTLNTLGSEDTWGIDTNPTKDKVFVPCYDDVVNSQYQFFSGTYIQPTNTRIASNTAYAANKPGMYASTTCADAWWLRNSARDTENAYSVLTSGMIEVDACPVQIICGIRPAIYVDLSDTSLWKAGDKVQSAALEEGTIINDRKNETDGNLPLSSEKNPFGTTPPLPTAPSTDSGQTEASTEAPSVPDTTTERVTTEAATTESHNTDQTNKIKIQGQEKPTVVKNLKVKAKGSGKIQIKWKKVNNGKQYRIQLSQKKNFANAKIKYSSSASIVWKGLKRKKQYYVRVQAVSSDGQCGGWSKAKKVKVR